LKLCIAFSAISFRLSAVLADSGKLTAESYYNSPRMTDVAIIGAGEVGGLIAHVLARRDAVAEIRLIDESGRVAAGKALDITQAAPSERFAARVSGAID